MRHSLVVAAALLAGCGQGTAEVNDLAVVVPDMTALDLTQPKLCEDNQVGDAGVTPTFTNVQGVFDFACIGCHCCGDPLDLTKGHAYADIVNRSPPPMSDKSTNESCGGTLVKPGDPAGSYLYQKISTTMPCAGQPMPLQEFQFVPLPQCAQDLVRRWIEAGAPND